VGISSGEEKIGRENECEPNSPIGNEIEVSIPFRVESNLDLEDPCHPGRRSNRKGKSSPSGFVSLEKTGNDRIIYEIS